MLRHAEAEQDGPSDAERALAERGHRDARECGAWLAGEGVAPDAALVSAALRARETWQEVCAGGGYDATLAVVDRGLYQAGPDAALDLVRLTDDEVGTLVVVGHNPTMQMLCLLLDDGEGTLDPSDDVPPCTAVVFEIEGPWGSLGSQGARSVARQVPGD